MIQKMNSLDNVKKIYKEYFNTQKQVFKIFQSSWLKYA